MEIVLFVYKTNSQQFIYYYYFFFGGGGGCKLVSFLLLHVGFICHLLQLNHPDENLKWEIMKKKQHNT